MFNRDVGYYFLPITLCAGCVRFVADRLLLDGVNDQWLDNRRNHVTKIPGCKKMLHNGDSKPLTLNIKISP